VKDLCVPLFMSDENFREARRALKGAGDDLDQAVASFREYVVNNREHLDELLKAILAEVLREMVWSAPRRRRA
jgi:hypothetical protein